MPITLPRNVGYPYVPAAPAHSPITSPHRYSGTSSAFSASANPNEDWTKISDLAERRRIQNRIAQRNYRKKLKKRLEDLERKAASSSASPEQHPADLDRPAPSPRQMPSPSLTAESHDAADCGRRRVTPDLHTHARSRSQPQPQLHQPLYPPAPRAADERAMFAHQYVRQLSTSPPPLSYSAYPAPDAAAYAPFSAPALPYPGMPASAAAARCPGAVAAPTTAPPDLPPLSVLYPQGLVAPPIKAEYYADDDISPFSMTYASMAGIDISAANAYHDAEAQRHTPPLSESFDPSVAGSPPDSAAYPATPDSLRRTPSLHFVS